MLLKDNTSSTIVYWFMVPTITCAIKLPPSAINIDFPVLAPACSLNHYQATGVSSALSLIIDKLMVPNRQDYKPYNTYFHDY